jgi:hypothetical protein
MLRRSRILAAAALILAVAAPGLPAAAATSAVSGVTLTSDERGCTEAAYYRRGLVSKVRPLVPEQYVLHVVEESPEYTGPRPRVDLLTNEFSCQQVTTGGVKMPAPVVTVIVSTLVTLPDGTEDYYVLLHATENLVQSSVFNYLGWPVDQLDQASSGSVTRNDRGQINSLRLRVVGSGWDHELTAEPTAPVPEPVPEPEPMIFYREVDGVLLKLCYQNNIGGAPGVVTGDLSRTPLASLTSAPPVLYPSITLGRSSFAVGSWVSTLTSGSCPA